jgi:16S rRNA (guanine966-N2)-methyltransferase
VDSNKGRVRIIAGEYRGRRLNVASRADLRPTPDRVRETLFNWLGQWLDGVACLDLFAGSGALGFEAASRGAARVVLVDNDPVVVKELERSRALIRATRVEVVRAHWQDYLDASGERFDIVFLDPPFRQNALAAVFERLPPRLAPKARVYAEAAKPLEPQPGWVELKRSRAGQVSYQLFQWRGDDQGRIPRNV